MISFSGGVDSTVCAALVQKAIGKRLIAVHVNTGYMRKGESEQVQSMMKNLSLNYRVIDASNDYYTALKGVQDPERKRKIIGEKFIRIFEQAAKKEQVQFLFRVPLRQIGLNLAGGYVIRLNHIITSGDCRKKCI